MNQTLDPL